VKRLVLLRMLAEPAMTLQNSWRGISYARYCEGSKWRRRIELGLFVILKMKLELEWYMISHMAF
jgi:hypothetical protein